MTYAQALGLGREAIFVALAVCAAPLLLGLLTGLVVSIFQAVTQIQEQSLSFIPKIIGIAGVIVVLGPWMLSQLVTYTQQLYMAIPQMVGG
jgi:flagellar biosynthesis protein FliQ